MTRKQTTGREMALEGLRNAQAWIEGIDGRTVPRDPFIRHTLENVKNSLTTLIDAQEEMVERRSDRVTRLTNAS